METGDGVTLVAAGGMAGPGTEGCAYEMVGRCWIRGTERRSSHSARMGTLAPCYNNIIHPVNHCRCGMK